MLGAGRGGLIGLLVFVAVLYFSGAGKWMSAQLSQMDTACYTAMSSAQWASPYAQTVCGGVAKGMSAIDHAATWVGDYIGDWRETLGGSSLHKISTYTSAFGERLSSLSSSQAELDRLITSGPKFYGQSIPTAEQFQTAMDSFAIGQLYMRDSATISQALPWLQNGAAQPQGFGVASQLTLGSLYAQGGQGVPQDPQMAVAYLEQAKQSIGMLSSSNTPQSQQLLHTLPAPPEVMTKQLEQAIRSIQTSARR